MSAWSLECEDCQIRYPQNAGMYLKCLGCGGPTKQQMRSPHEDFKERAFKIYGDLWDERHAEDDKAVATRLDEIVDEVVVTIETPIESETDA